MLTFSSTPPTGGVKATISGLRLAKASRNYPKWQRARDAASWVRGDILVTPTIKCAASVFGVSAVAVKEALEFRKHRPVNGNGTIAPTDDAVDRIVAAIGADRVLAAIDRATQPQLPLQAAE